MLPRIDQSQVRKYRYTYYNIEYKTYIIYTIESDLDDSVTDPFDVREIFDLVRGINDPEHPLSLEQLNVVSEDQINVDDKANSVQV